MPFSFYGIAKCQRKYSECKGWNSESRGRDWESKGRYWESTDDVQSMVSEETKLQLRSEKEGGTVKRPVM